MKFENWWRRYRKSAFGQIFSVWLCLYGLFLTVLFAPTWPRYLGKGLELMPLWALAPYLIIGFLGGGRLLQWFHSECRPGRHCRTGYNQPCWDGCKTKNHCMNYTVGFLVPVAIFWLPALIIGTIAFACWQTGKYTAKSVLWVSVPAYAKAHPICTPKASTQPQVMPAADLKTLHTEVFGTNKPEIIKMIEIED